VLARTGGDAIIGYTFARIPVVAALFQAIHLETEVLSRTLDLVKYSYFFHKVYLLGT